MTGVPSPEALTVPVIFLRAGAVACDSAAVTSVQVPGSAANPISRKANQIFGALFHMLQRGLLSLLAFCCGNLFFMIC